MPKAKAGGGSASDAVRSGVAGILLLLAFASRA
jgi:hypothetical protein